MKAEYQDAHGKTSRLVDHHMLLPHEIIGSFYDSNKLDLVTGPATGLHVRCSVVPRCVANSLQHSLKHVC